MRHGHVICIAIAASLITLLLQVLAIGDEYSVRLTGQLYAQVLESQLIFSNKNASSEPSGELDGVLHSNV